MFEPKNLERISQGYRLASLMNMHQIDNVNIVSERVLPPPAEVRRRWPLTVETMDAICGSREQVRAILDRRDPKLLMIVGPCSIHNISDALEYARKLANLSDEVRDTLMLIMRVYFEKPRTSVGWKGFINDPCLDDSFQIDSGLSKARELLLNLAQIGLPVATEAVDPITPQYIGDLISWTAIGARTTESQTHREMASGLSTPVGFKNGTDGNIDTAINAIKATSTSHHFLGINEQGQSAVFHTRGNQFSHIVLRGGFSPNYDPASISCCEKSLLDAQLPVRIVVDCSHRNSQGDPNDQLAVMNNCVQQIINGNNSILGFMLESNLVAGNQKIPNDLSSLRPGVSITDPCIDWDATETIVMKTRNALSSILPKRIDIDRSIP